MFRDSSGRTRVDHGLDQQERSRVIVDPVAHAGFVLDMKEKIFYKISGDGELRTGWSFSGGRPSYTGDRDEIFGIECVRMSLPPGKTSDEAHPASAWLSEQKGIVMREDDPSVGWTWKIVSIELREPDPAIFEIPEGFTEVSMTDEAE